MRRRGRDRYTPAKARFVARKLLPDGSAARKELLKSGTLWTISWPSGARAGGIWIAKVVRCDPS